MKTIDIQQELENNSYPGRGIILGRSADNENAVIAYWIMGRSANTATVCSPKRRTASRQRPLTPANSKILP